ncbi:hypothetical protein [Chiayiivirga flava]|uniref:DUF1440 domain-containing protein n=1 Tax=Chiayiivirga flava TaxID=659595 RepID=A0A7W8D2X6_9GAMM|nr:hypothetical protein [Chiayiivirga flava]MBB5206980.1 hypothetical protein [Chiayiivirga flava]
MPATDPAVPRGSEHGPGSPRRIVLAAGLIAASLDIAFAIGFWALRDVPAQRILQSVASGVLGADAYAGGAASAALGLVLHIAIAVMMAMVYDMASLRLRILVRRPVLFGAMYGVLLFGAMNWLVVPLSAAAMAPPSGLWLWCGLAAHIVLVGIPCALGARLADAARRRRGPDLR